MGLFIPLSGDADLTPRESNSLDAAHGSMPKRKKKKKKKAPKKTTTRRKNTAY